MMDQTSLSGRAWSQARSVDDFEGLKKTLLERLIEADVSLDEPFFNPSEKDLHDPFFIKGMEEAVKTIERYIVEGKRIMVYGDFDADGVTSTVILVQALRELGAEVSYRIPDRTKHSHGLNKAIIDEIVGKKVGLLLTCDCGINDQEEVAYAVSKGLEVIVTDHHDPDPSRFPDKAVAVLNPLRKACSYPDKNLSGAGIALKLVQALGLDLAPYLELAAIGIIADCVPLRGESRTIAKLGLEALRETRWEPLQAFFAEQEISPESLDEDTIGFHLAPRINAASRLGDVTRATQLFLGENGRIAERWEYLHELNRQRKNLTERILAEALEQLDESASCQVVLGPHWPQGILGLVASRISEMMLQPVVALRDAGEGVLSASCRAPRTANMIEALRACDDLLLHYGGHAGAAGFTCREQDFESLRYELNKFFIQNKKGEVLLPVLASLPIHLLVGYSDHLLDFLKSLSPFGIGHERPLFSVQALRILSLQPLGQSGDHFRITGARDDQILELVAFFKKDWAGRLPIGHEVDVAFTVGENHFRGERQMQLIIEDIRVLSSLDSGPNPSDH